GARASEGEERVSKRLTRRTRHAHAKCGRSMLSPERYSKLTAAVGFQPRSPDGCPVQRKCWAEAGAPFGLVAPGPRWRPGARLMVRLKCTTSRRRLRRRLRACVAV